MDDAFNAYYEHFGVNYPFWEGDPRSEEELIADAMRCIKNNKEADPPKFDDDKDY